MRVKRRVQGFWEADIYQVNILKYVTAKRNQVATQLKEASVSFLAHKNLLRSLSHDPEHISTLLQAEIPLKSEQICMVMIQ